MEIFNDMLIIKIRVKSMRYFQSMPFTFVMIIINLWIRQMWRSCLKV